MAPWGPGLRSGLSTLTVINGTANASVVKVIKLGKKDRLMRNFYVPAGKRFPAEKISAGATCGASRRCGRRGDAGQS
jgi:hypothetical protein